MEAQAIKTDIVQQLQKEILSLQQGKRLSINQVADRGLQPLARAFPNSIFPTGVMHELVSSSIENAAATNGFISWLLHTLMQKQGVCLWVGIKSTIFPPALKLFGIDPERIIFIDVARSKDALWAIEEGLKCDVLTAVVGEITDLTFTQSRRLQLAVEDSQVTGFIHRKSPKVTSTTACVARWQITQMPSVLDNGMPGVGYPRWQVQLLKVRNGKPSSWSFEWTNGAFHHIEEEQIVTVHKQTRKTG